MNLESNEKTAIFIDGQHLYVASRQLGFDVDYRKFLEYFRTHHSVIRAYYYCVMVENGDTYSPLKPLTDWLCYNGYDVTVKYAKESVDTDGRRRTRGHIEIEVVTDMLMLARQARLDHVILVAGNGDYKHPVEALKSLGLRVTAMSTRSTSPPMIADELRRHVDDFIDLADVAKHFTRRTRDTTMPAPTPTPAEPFAVIDDEEIVQPRTRGTRTAGRTTASA